MRLALAALFALAIPAAAQEHIARSDAKSPADEKKSFKLPPGFEAQLVASEPDIGKPIQIAFDARGRLWVTTSRHYPFPAAAGEKPLDRLFVLSDFGPDGKAGKIQTFADDLNIPIGILPLPDCKSCLVSHVGSILKLTDTDGDGKADQRETILTGFGTRDTHGMMNSFVLLPDGWVYACHGYSNQSVVKAKDGSEVRMQSGNTFRFRPDGSRVEPWTFGQVNPFGMTVDPYFNLYTADCHTKPITQLIRGAYYDSFGKPHDGLGYAPHVTHHDHGSTALCGLAWYDADHFPKEYLGTMFLGNVVTNRINFDKITWAGSTPVAKEQPDFLASSDPWFRPTDIKLGPDGALYVADFYNRIIGHYEVPLNHPQRDKDRGRVWRIVWKGTDGAAKPPTMPGDLTTARDNNLADLLGSPNITVRSHVTHELIRRHKAGQKPGEVEVKNRPEDQRTRMMVHIGWASLEIGELDLAGLAGLLNGEDLQKWVGRNGVEFARSHILRAAASAALIPAELRSGAAKALESPDAHTKRAAIDALAAHPHADNVAPLVKLIHDCPAADTHLKFAARVALRNALRDAPGAWAAAAKADPDVVADVAVAVPTKEAASYLFERVRTASLTNHYEPRYFERVGRYGDDTQAAALIEQLDHQVKFDASPTVGRYALCTQELVRGLQSRGGSVPAGGRARIERICSRCLRDPHPGAPQASMELAGGLKLAPLFDPLVAFAAKPETADPLRAAAVSALLAIDAPKASTVLGGALTDPAVPTTTRERVAQVLGTVNQPGARAALVAALQTAPAKLSSAIAAALASSPPGADALLDAIKSGKASPRLLQEKAISTKLLAINGGRLRPRIDELTKGLPSADAKLDALIRTRADAFAKAKPDAAKGKEVFAKSCAVCHQIGGQGAKVGPNLDGIGNRGLDRLLEDVLDPNRNIDLPFRATVVNTLDGRTLTGQFLREEGQVTVLADAMGKEIRIEAKDIDKKTTSTISIMPANVDTTIPEADFYHLLAYLMAQRVNEAK